MIRTFNGGKVSNVYSASTKSITFDGITVSASVSSSTWTFKLKSTTACTMYGGANLTESELAANTTVTLSSFGGSMLGAILIFD